LPRAKAVVLIEQLAWTAAETLRLALFDPAKLGPGLAATIKAPAAIADTIK
jgi:hypothetical protein